MPEFASASLLMGKSIVQTAAAAAAAWPQVLHARSCSHTARQLAQFFAACHLIFSTGCDNVYMAMDSLPAPGQPHNPLGPSSPTRRGAPFLGPIKPSPLQPGSRAQ